MNKDVDIFYNNYIKITYTKRIVKSLKISNDNKKKTHRSTKREQCRYYLGYIFLLP